MTINMQTADGLGSRSVPKVPVPRVSGPAGGRATPYPKVFAPSAASGSRDAGARAPRAPDSSAPPALPGLRRPPPAAPSPRRAGGWPSARCTARHGVSSHAEPPVIECAIPVTCSREKASRSAARVVQVDLYGFFCVASIPRLTCDGRTNITSARARANSAHRSASG